MCTTLLPYEVCLMLLHLGEQGKTKLVAKVRLALFRFGFRYILPNERSQAINMLCLRQRLSDSRRQRWKSRIDASDRFTFLQTV